MSNCSPEERGSTARQDSGLRIDTVVSATGGIGACDLDQIRKSSMIRAVWRTCWDDFKTGDRGTTLPSQMAVSNDDCAVLGPDLCLFGSITGTWQRMSNIRPILILLARAKPRDAERVQDTKHLASQLGNEHSSTVQPRHASLQRQPKLQGVHHST